MFDVQYLSLLLVAVGLSADCFAVAVSTSIANRNLRLFHFSRISLTFGTFHTIMPAIGWLAGYTVIKFIGGFDHWLAFVLLGFIGGKMVWSALRRSEKRDRGTDITNITRMLPLIIIGVATSIDALAAGLSFSFMKANLMLSCITVGVVVAGVALAGFFVGRKVGAKMGKRAEIVGGLILMGIGIKVAVEHMV
jgi:putative Mn2+ efflux pump MntP